jgi:xylulokinase
MRAHFARAVFEGISFGMADCLGVLKNLGSEPKELRVTGGGAKSRFWLQMLADVLQTPCLTLESDEGPAHGAALLAGVGIGIWTDVESACRKTIETRSRVEPSGIDYSRAYERYKMLYPKTRESELNL